MKTNTLRMLVRFIGLIELTLGIVFWTGNARMLVIGHITLGLLFTLVLAVLTYQAYRTGVSKWLVLVAAIWTIGLPVWGMAQDRIFPGTYNRVSEVLHLLCGLGAIGVGELLSSQINKKR